MIEKFIAAVSVLGLILGIGMMIGLAGGLETDLIDYKSYIIKTGICILILIFSVIGVNYTEKDDSKYEKL